MQERVHLFLVAYLSISPAHCSYAASADAPQTSTSQHILCKTRVVCGVVAQGAVEGSRQLCTGNSPPSVLSPGVSRCVASIDVAKGWLCIGGPAWLSPVLLSRRWLACKGYRVRLLWTQPSCICPLGGCFRCVRCSRTLSVVSRPQVWHGGRMDHGVTRWCAVTVA